MFSMFSRPAVKFSVSWNLINFYVYSFSPFINVWYTVTLLTDSVFRIGKALRVHQCYLCMFVAHNFRLIDWNPKLYLNRLFLTIDYNNAPLVLKLLFMPFPLTQNEWLDHCALSGNYGQSGMTAFKELAEESNVCIAKEDTVLSNAEDSTYDEVRKPCYLILRSPPI